MNASASQPQSSQNMWFSISLGLIGVIIGYAAATFTQPAQQPPAQADTPPPAASSAPPPNLQDIPAVDAATDHIRGNPSASVSVITYSDFECPFSKRHHPTLQQILDAYGNDVNVVYRHFPLSFHQNAEKEAEASECVAELGGNDAFWKFADGIYEKTTSNGTGFALDQLPVLAKQVGVDENAFKTCLDSGKYQAKIAAEMQAGSKAGIDGTPGTVIVRNATKEAKLVVGAQPLDAFKTAIDALKK